MLKRLLIRTFDIRKILLSRVKYELRTTGYLDQLTDYLKYETGYDYKVNFFRECNNKYIFVFV